MSSRDTDLSRPRMCTLKGPSSGKGPSYGFSGRAPGALELCVASPSAQSSTFTLRRRRLRPLSCRACSREVLSLKSMRAVCRGTSNCSTFFTVTPFSSKYSLMSSSVAVLSMPLMRTAKGPSLGKSTGSCETRCSGSRSTSSAKYCQSFSGCWRKSSAFSLRSCRPSSATILPVLNSSLTHVASSQPTNCTPSTCTRRAPATRSSSSQRTNSPAGCGRWMTPLASS
mmetsp:Transcript_100330/g.323783  ORF Transcript_100330/g.323783 Transcript_100330/m.323783 type:complete len:226 (-) Transcript_100330:1054-1731(-)